MAKLRVVVEGGSTVVTIDGDVVSGLTGFKFYCEGENNGADKINLRFSGSPFGATVVSVNAEIELDIDDALATALKG